MQTINAKNIVSIAGIATQQEKECFWWRYNVELLEKIKEKTEIFQVGTISGISGSIMTECYLRGCRNKPAGETLAQSDQGSSPGHNCP